MLFKNFQVSNAFIYGLQFFLRLKILDGNTRFRSNQIILQPYSYSYTKKNRSPAEKSLCGPKIMPINLILTTTRDLTQHVNHKAVCNTLMHATEFQCNPSQNLAQGYNLPLNYTHLGLVKSHFALQIIFDVINQLCKRQVVGAQKIRAQ